mgnify:CR=1 FL=1
MVFDRGELSNKGLEIALQFNPISTDDLDISFGGNIAFNETRIEGLSSQSLSPVLIDGSYVDRRFYLGNTISRGNYFKYPANIFIEGEETALFYGFQTDGIYQTGDTTIGDAQAGDVRIIDQNGDNVIDLSDRTVIGNPNPDYTFGINLSVRYKSFSLSALVNGVYGNEIINGNLIQMGNAEGLFRNILSDAYHGAWRPEKPSNSYPRIGYLGNDGPEFLAISDRYVEDGSYLRLNNVTILDGQGLYVTRSDDDYFGTFLFENNLCVNNGKNGINFDRSNGSSALVRNNTIYFNGVHEIIQDISESEGNPPHRGQKVAGIKTNFFKNIRVVNNIVVTREYAFFAMQLQNQQDGGTIKEAKNNIFVNGKLPGYTNSSGTYVNHNWVTENNQIISNVDFNSNNFIDPIYFKNAPAIVNGPVDMSTTDFSLQANSPAINAGNSDYSPTKDILGNSRPIVPGNANVISSSSFETAADGWSNFGSTLIRSTETAKSGSKSLKTSARTKNFHSPRIFLNSLLEVDKSYTFYVWVKLAEGSGTVQLTVKSTVNGATADENVDTYTNLASTTATANDWVLLTDNYTHTQNDQSFLYVKGPAVSAGQGVDYYIDDFSLVNIGENEVDFTAAGDIVDIGAYEYQSQPLSISDNPTQANTVYAYPNPTKDMLTLINLTNEESIAIYDVLGRKQPVQQQRKTNQLKLNVSMLDTGIYFIHVSNTKGKTKSIRFIKK